VQAINEGKTVSRSFLVQNLVSNTNINLAGIGITLIGLQASGALVIVLGTAVWHTGRSCCTAWVLPSSSRTMLAAAMSHGRQTLCS
jgi:hypothetical protein